MCRSNFDTFGESALTIFQIISGENWNEVLYDGIQSTSWAAMAYFVLVFMGAQFIIMNLYIAILLRDYQTGDPPSMEFLIGILTCGMYNICPDRLQEDWFAEESDNDDDPGSPMELEIENNLQPIQAADWSIRSIVLLQGEARRRAKVSKTRKLGTNSRCSWVNLDKVYDKDNKADWPLQGKSLFIFSPTNGLRIWLAELVEHPAFEAGVLLIILISSVLLVIEFESKVDKDHGVGYALSVSTPLLLVPTTDCCEQIVDYIITFIFLIELIIRCIVQGFLFGDKSFWKSGWNRIDFVSTLMSVLALIFGDSFKAVSSHATSCCCSDPGGGGVCSGSRSKMYSSAPQCAACSGASSSD